MKRDAFGARGTLADRPGTAALYRLGALEKAGLAPGLDRLPFSIKVLLEAVLRNVDGELVTRGRRAATSRPGTPPRPGTWSCPSCPRG